MGLQDKHQMRSANPDKSTDMEHIADQKQLTEGQLFKRRDKHQINKRRIGLQGKHQMRTANPEKNTDMEHIAYEKSWPKASSPKNVTNIR